MGCKQHCLFIVKRHCVMQTRYILVAAALVAAFVLVSWLRSRSVSPPLSELPQQVSLAQLTDGEQHVYGLFRDVQGHAILTESFVREGGDVKVVM
jgi:hypothetical protein